jgi:predicted RNA-binding protein YlqC (UPF0109 family)
LSAFDDEFGLFGDDEPKEDEERKPTLGARKIASDETTGDGDIEPEDDRPRRPRRGMDDGPPGARPRFGGDRGGPRRERAPRPQLAPEVSEARAIELLTFLAKKLVAAPEKVVVVTVEGDRGPVIELEVDPDDLGKVIGRGGRVAQALRTLVRAGAEGRVTVDIVDSEDTEDPASGDPGEPEDEA